MKLTIGDADYEFLNFYTEHFSNVNNCPTMRLCTVYYISVNCSTCFGW